jgi:hypothetical protein
MSPDKLVPFRWPSVWRDPALLALLDGGPINCLLLGPATGTSPIAEPARRAGLTVFESDSASGQNVLTDLVWPRMRLSPKGRPDDTEAGPTGAPWIDSNSWVARLASVRTPGKPVWLSFDPDPKEPAPEEAGYTVAIADSAATGARWIVSLDDGLVKALPAGNEAALKQWRGILAALSFFEKRRDWRAWEPWGPLGVLSSFAGKDAYLGHEVLNLAATRCRLEGPPRRVCPGRRPAHRPARRGLALSR